MADGDGPLSRPAWQPGARRAVPGLWPGRLALGFLALLCGGALAGLGLEAAGDWRSLAAAFDGRVLAIARFTLYQAVLSTALSVVPALAVARALSRHPRFFGRAALLRLFAVPLALPAIVAALGVLALYGRAGLLAEPLSALAGGRWPGIYGLSGILVAHVFFNLPLATRLLIEALQTVPADHWRLASQLGMGGAAQWRLIEWPVLRAALPGIAGLVFMLCVTSFTIVLTLGGGPAATTLEVAIYQALRFDFDPGMAVALTLLQLVLTGAIVLALVRLGGTFAESATLSVVTRRPAMANNGETVLNAIVIALAAAFVLAPMGAVVVAGFKADLARLAGETAVIGAAATSLALALAAAILSVALSMGLVAARKRLEKARRGRASLLELASDTGAGMILVVPPIVLGAGWFVLLRHVGDVFALAPAMVIAVNAAMAMPFVVRAIRPAHDNAAERHDRLAASLGIRGFNRLRLVDWPVLRAPLLAGFAFAMALSLGDLGVIALFGSDSVQTLPYLLLARLGSYRTADAAGLALLLALLTLALMAIAGRLEGRR
ncbi:MAG: thiamine/thiamine pyrophosphate ABC transporter permease [Rhizobiaceae bacterium]